MKTPEKYTPGCILLLLLLLLQLGNIRLLMAMTTVVLRVTLITLECLLASQRRDPSRERSWINYQSIVQVSLLSDIRTVDLRSRRRRLIQLVNRMGVDASTVIKRVIQSAIIYLSLAHKFLCSVPPSRFLWLIHDKCMWGAFCRLFSPPLSASLFLSWQMMRREIILLT